MFDTKQCSYVTVEKIKVSQASTGQDIFISKIIIKGTNPKAASVYIQASVHASELQGNAVMVELLEYFKKYQPSGDIYLVPQCNPIGMDEFQGAGHQGRFDSATGDNWNRYYFNPKIDYQSFVRKYINQSTEVYKHAFEKLLLDKLKQQLKQELFLSRAKKLNYLLQEQAQQADYVLDLHTDTDAITYLYTPEYAKKTAEIFGYKYALVIANDVFTGALDEAVFVPWSKLQQEFKNQGRNEKVLKECFTLELGSEENINSYDAIRQSQGILRYLQSKKIIDSPFETDKLSDQTVQYDIANFKQIQAIQGGLYEWFVKPGDCFKAGETIGEYIQTASMSKKPVSFAFNGLVISIHTRGAACQGTQLLNLVIN